MAAGKPRALSNKGVSDGAVMDTPVSVFQPLCFACDVERQPHHWEGGVNALNHMGCSSCGSFQKPARVHPSHSDLVAGIELANHRATGTNRYNLPVEAHCSEFDTTFNRLPISEHSPRIGATPLHHYPDIVSGILPFPDESGAVHNSPLDVIPEDQGQIYPPNYDAPTTPVQSTQSHDHRLVVVIATAKPITRIVEHLTQAEVDVHQLEETFKPVIGPRSNENDPSDLSLKKSKLEMRVPTCSICGISDVECILLPCGHAGTCRSCADKIAQMCPFCRQLVTSKHNLFFP